MKKKDKDKLNMILNQCLENLKSWDKITSTIKDLLNQLHGLNRANWKVFELSDSIKTDVKEALEVRIYGELEGLGKEVLQLDNSRTYLQEYIENLNSYCATQIQNVTNTSAFEVLRMINSLSSCLGLIVGIAQFPLPRVHFQDLESFKFLDDANDALKGVRKDFEDLVSQCTARIIADVEF